jgi:hypothetical protein
MASPIQLIQIGQRITSAKKLTWSSGWKRAGSSSGPHCHIASMPDSSRPHSLERREIRLDCSGNCRKSTQFRNYCSQTGPEKVFHSTPQATFRALFSGGHIGSPVSTTPPGECNAITNRSFGESHPINVEIRAGCELMARGSYALCDRRLAAHRVPSPCACRRQNRESPAVAFHSRTS